jgi:hypothetical protein
MNRALPFLLFVAAWQPYVCATDIYVSPAGSDRSPGNRARPLASLPAAQKMARKLKSSGPVTVWLRAGTYYLAAPLLFTPEDSGTAQHRVTYRSAPGEEAVISGGIRLNLTWTPYRDGIMMARMPAGLQTDQLFVNGKPQILARYPNYDPSAAYFDGWSPDALSR